MQLYTIGHSNRTLTEFITLLKEFNIIKLIDVRAYPGSKRVPWTNQNVLQNALMKVGITYRHCPALGGKREPSHNSINLGWKNSGFRGFADYMQTSTFIQAIDDLNIHLNAEHGTVIMCAELDPKNCHRTLIADAEVIRQVDVLHILKDQMVVTHTLTPFAVPSTHFGVNQLFYPLRQSTLDI